MHIDAGLYAFTLRSGASCPLEDRLHKYDAPCYLSEAALRGGGRLPEQGRDALPRGPGAGHDRRAARHGRRPLFGADQRP